jgi:CRP-like cAMP-binding protein
MERQLIRLHEATNRQIVPLATPACRKVSGARCGLPLGMAMVCGDARHREDFAPDSEVMAGGERSNDVWLIRSGILRLQRHAYDGHRQILSLFFPGEIIGFEGEFREGVSVETATQSGLCRIDRRRFEAMLDQNDTLRADLFRQKQDQLDRLYWLTWSLGALSPEERLCAFLARASKIMPYQPLPDGTGILSMQLPRKDIADLLGTTVETISRTVHKLADSGVIEIRDPAHFRFLDMPKLIAIGQIESHFDRMCQGLANRRHQLDDRIIESSDSAVCFCGRQSASLTPVNEGRARADDHPLVRNLSSGG